MDLLDLRAYKCWFEFLRRSAAYKKYCDEGGNKDFEKIYIHFGNIHAPGLTWEDWWKTHEYLFTTIEPRFIVNEMINGAEFDGWDSEGEEDLLALLINLNEPKQKILEVVEKIVSARQLKLRRLENNEISNKKPGAKLTERRGRPKIDIGRHHYYGLSAVPTSALVTSLEITLEVYDMCTSEGRQPPMSPDGWIDIADELGIIITPLKTRQDEYGALSEGAERNRSSEKVKRYFRQAGELITNVEKGIFPVHSQ